MLMRYNKTCLITFKSKEDFRKRCPHKLEWKPAMGRAVSSVELETVAGAGVDIFLSEKLPNRTSVCALYIEFFNTVSLTYCKI